MEATKQQIANIFNGHRILEVPYYQRNYVWHEEQWKRFLEDMAFISYSKQDYFLGSVILKQQKTDMGEANDKRTIIDGQQRFTTLVIFSKVLCLKTNDEEPFNQNFTVRNRKERIRESALIHSLNDRKDFEKVMWLTDNKPIEVDYTSNIIKAFNYFYENIEPEKYDIDAILAHIVFIAIELQENDDEQAIFDTINSLGVRLTTAELLKNYFFTEHTREEYEELWRPIFERDRDVSSYWDMEITRGRTKRTNIDAFFASYLSVKIQDPQIGVDPEHKNIYRRADSIFTNYKSLVSTFHLDKTDLLYDILDYAEIYFQNINPDIDEIEIPGTPCIERINFLIYVLDSSTLLPYVLYILKNVKSIKERNNIFGYLESYIVRRIICKSDNNNYSDLFGQSLIAYQANTLEKLKDYIEARGNEQALALPVDQSVREHLHTVTHPNKRALAILYLMESRLRTGKPHATHLYAFNDYTLEHLMPKKYEKNWPLNDGYDEDTRVMMINTLGNMAMLPSRLNSSISNADWTTKKNGKKHLYGLSYYASDLVTLKNVIKEKEWNEDKIADRADRLADVVINIWPSYLPGMEVEDTYNIPEDKEIGVAAEDSEINDSKKYNQNHDYTRYSLNGSSPLSKAEFVFTIIKSYMDKYPNVTYKQLKRKFPDMLCATGYKFRGLLVTEDDYNSWNNKYKEKRYQPNKPGRRLVSSDGIVFFVNTQWTIDAMKKFVKMSKEEGWTVESIE